MYKYPRWCWWSSEKGQSESAHPYHSSSFSLSLSLPSIHPLFSSSSSSTSIIFHVVTMRLFMGEKHRGLHLAGKLWPLVGVDREASNERCKQSKTINYTSAKRAFLNRGALMSRFSDPPRWIIVQVEVEGCNSIHFCHFILFIEFIYFCKNEPICSLSGLAVFLISETPEAKQKDAWSYHFCPLRTELFIADWQLTCALFICGVIAAWTMTLSAFLEHVIFLDMPHYLYIFHFLRR